MENVGSFQFKYNVFAITWKGFVPKHFTSVADSFVDRNVSSRISKKTV